MNANIMNLMIESCQCMINSVIVVSLVSRYYVKARAVLLQYQHMPSFHGIQRDCNEIVNELRTKLREQFRDREVRFCR